MEHVQRHQRVAADSSFTHNGDAIASSCRPSYGHGAAVFELASQPAIVFRRRRSGRTSG